MTKKVLPTDLLMQPIAQFSFGMRAGSIIRIGATAGTDAARRMAGARIGLADPAAQSAAMLENIAMSLRLLGGGVAEVVHLRSYIHDWRDLPAYAAALENCWPDWQGCHSIVGSNGFPLPQAAVEAEAVAVVGAARSALRSQGLPAPAAGGSNAGVRAGRPHLCSVGPAAAGAAPPADALAQARSTLDHLHLALDAAGLQLRDLVMLNVSVADLRDLPAFDAELRRRLPAPHPARTVCGTSLAGAAWLFSVDAIAVAGGGVPVEVGPGREDAPAAAAMLAGDELFIGGQRGGAAGAPCGTVGEQTHAAWHSIHALLEAAGMGPDDILHTTNTLTDWRSYGEFNQGYGHYVSAPYPPRATVLGALPVPGARVMIEAHAHRAARDGTVIGYVPPPA